MMFALQPAIFSVILTCVQKNHISRARNARNKSNPISETIRTIVKTECLEIVNSKN